MIMAFVFLIAGSVLFLGGLIRAVIVTYDDKMLFWPWISVAVSGMALQLVGIGMIPQ